MSLVGFVGPISYVVDELGFQELDRLRRVDPSPIQGLAYGVPWRHSSAARQSGECHCRARVALFGTLGGVFKPGLSELPSIAVLRART